MPRLYFLPLLALPVLVSSVTYAQTSRVYFAGYLGFTSFNEAEVEDNDTNTSGTIEPDNAPSFAGALGLRINRNARLEGEFSYREANITNAEVGGENVIVGGDLRQTSVLLNGYYDFDMGWEKTMPYLSAGVGVSQYKGDLDSPSGAFTSVSDTAYGITYNLGAGVKYRVSPGFAWTGGYRYVDGTDVTLGNTDLDVSSHEFRIGLEYDLGY